MKHDLQTIEGKIEHLAIGQSRVNLLHGLAGANVQGTGAALQALAGNIGQAATGSMVAMYDGEEMDHFACYVGEHLIQGVFPHVTFADGDEVKVVIQQRGNEKHAQAILCPNRGLLWMPLMLGWGVGATLKQSFRTMAWATIAVSVMFGFIFYIERHSNPPFIGMIFPPAIGTIFALWDFKDFRHHGQLSSAIFKLLGFKNPVWLDLRKFSLMRLNHDLHGECVYRYDLAMRSERPAVEKNYGPH